jgi:glutamine synthetase
MALFSRVSSSRLAPALGRRSLCAPAKLAAMSELLYSWDRMEKDIGADAYAKFKSSQKDGSGLDKATANAVAKSMKEWAMENGCVSYAHWFSPVRGEPIQALNGLKHDAFIDLDFGDAEVVKPIVTGSFNGSKLFMNETDGSSFPNGGLRATHTAAAYNSWDRLSPPFIQGDTLYIPAAFVAWTGAALDHKTPLLRSQEAINTAGMRLLKNLGDTTSEQVVSNVGWEQEFFVIDREMFLRRPDLMLTGRTVLGGLPARNQQTDMNYFGPMQPRVKALMEEVQAEAWKVGMAMSVYHNEVAPGQHEYSPIFSLTNIANDQNQLAMQMTNDIAARHGLVVLYHEKPFAGINGSGKHNNWGLNTDSGKNLYAAGKTEESQSDFVAFVAALSYAVNKHADVIRCSIATAGNDHRLGAQEAPPAIISLYTGPTLEGHLKSVMEGGALAGYGENTKMIPYGTAAVADVGGGQEDRNRTAPLPFCGNRFEFRAVGSSQNIAFPLTVLNTAVADGCDAISEKIEGGMSPRDAVSEVLTDNWRCIFNGNGYSDEWPIEAEARGLLNLKNSPAAFATFADEKNQVLFEKHNIFSRDETVARAETLHEQYIAQVTMEADIMIEMMETGIIPACAEDLKTYEGTKMGGDRGALYEDMAAASKTLAEVLSNLPEGEHESAAYCADTLIPAMNDVRELADTAEKKCTRALWPYPTYGDIIFTHQTEGAEQSYFH